MAEDAALNQESAESPEAAKQRPLSLLAAEKFGTDFHGTVPEDKPEDKQEETAEETEETEEPTEEPTSEQIEEQEEQPEQVPIASLNELIEHNELDPEWVQSLKIPVKVNGEEGEQSLSELVKSYQLHQATEAELSEAKAKSKATLEELNQQKEAIAESLQILQTMVQDEEAAIEAASKSINWSQLEEDDPGKAALEKSRLQERRAALQAKKQKALEAYKKTHEAQQQQQQQNLQQFVQTERTKLLEKVPEWRDPEKAQAEQNKLTEYLIGQGYTQEEIAKAYDHRLVVGLRKAMLWDEMQSKSQVAKKKVVKVPKVLKPGAPKPKEQLNRERIDKQRAKLRQTGSLDDAYALIKARRGN